ncbi:MAG TPA: hypothetical protein VFE84_03250 [Patescibacteria group bacterium]|nr:hypothetical protein [Patescibacteria group bacterium]
MAIAVFSRPGGQSAPARLRKMHWSTQGLVLCCFMRQGAGYSIYPRVSGHKYNTGAPVNGAALGISFTNASNSNIQLVPSPEDTIIPTQRATVLIVLHKDDATARNSVAWGSQTATSGTLINGSIPWGDGKVYFRFGASGNTLSVTPTTTAGTNAWAFVAGRNGMSIWENGVLQASSASAVTRTNGTDAFMLNNGSSTLGDNQTTHFFALLDAEWTPTQVLEWSANPWIMFDTKPLTMDFSSGSPPVTAKIPVFMHHYRQQGIA